MQPRKLHRRRSSTRLHSRCCSRRSRSWPLPSSRTLGAQPLHRVCSNFVHHDGRAVPFSLIDANGTDGGTALHLASNRGLTEVVELLLELGADPNQQNVELESPLHVAARACCCCNCCRSGCCYRCCHSVCQSCQIIRTPFTICFAHRQATATALLSSCWCAAAWTQPLVIGREAPRCTPWPGCGRLAFVNLRRANSDRAESAPKVLHLQAATVETLLATTGVETAKALSLLVARNQCVNSHYYASMWFWVVDLGRLVTLMLPTFVCHSNGRSSISMALEAGDCQATSVLLWHRAVLLRAARAHPRAADKERASTIASADGMLADLLWATASGDDPATAAAACLPLLAGAGAAEPAALAVQRSARLASTDSARHCFL